jgi:hypothetical protein
MKTSLPAVVWTEFKGATLMMLITKQKEKQDETLALEH